MRRCAVIVTLVVVAAALPRRAFAQMSLADLPARGALYVEFGAAAMTEWCSLNLELPVSDDVVVRAAAGREAFGDLHSSVLLAANKLIGARGTYLELGGGIVRSTCCVPGSEMWQSHALFDVGV